MIAHPTLDILSAHLDGELSLHESARLRRHLDECPRCRHDLDGLRRTVARLRDLEQEAPSDLLATRVQRLVAVEAGERGLGGRFERRRLRLPIQSSTLLSFSLVFAFAAILYLFAHAVEEQRTATIPVDLGTSAEPAASGVPSVVVADEEIGREMVWSGEAWTAEAASEPPGSVLLEVRRGSAQWKELVRHHPELASLPAAGDASIVRLHETERLRVLP